jgi:hypothetical protein
MITEKQRESARKYSQTPKGKACSARKNATASHKASKKKYDTSENGKLHHRKHKLKANYNMTIEDYTKKYNTQKGCCWICGVFYPVLCVDHNHETGQTRGLLCHNCNHLLGKAQDSIKVLLNSIKYLLFWNKNKTLF